MGGMSALFLEGISASLPLFLSSSLPLILSFSQSLSLLFLSPCLLSLSLSLFLLLFSLSRRGTSAGRLEVGHGERRKAVRVELKGLVSKGTDQGH